MIVSHEHNYQAYLVLCSSQAISSGPRLQSGCSSGILAHQRDGGELDIWYQAYVKTYTIVLLQDLSTPSPDIYIWGGGEEISKGELLMHYRNKFVGGLLLSVFT